MNRRFIYLASALFVFLCLAMGGIYWFITRPVSTPPIKDAVAETAARLRESAPKPVLSPPMPIKDRVRLAIGGLGFGEDEADRQIGDLTLAQLSGFPGLDLVERQSLDKVLGELGLNLSGLVRANDAVRAGKLLHADWFLLGTRAKIAGTNSVVVRIVDARTGIMRDAGVVTEGNSQTQLAGALAGFVREARQSAVVPKPRVYLAIGAFDDLSANNRQTDFAGQLRGYLISAYRGDNRVVLLEREYVDVLLQELELDLAGLTEEGTASPPQPLQSAFWLVDGSYQTDESGAGEIEVALNVQRMFGNSRHLVARGAPGEPVDRQVKQTIEAAFNQDGGFVFATRESEALAQLHKGKQMADLGSVHYPGYFFLSYGPETDPRQRRNLEEAIRAFKTVLLMDPTNREAKMYLTGCLRRQNIIPTDEIREDYRRILEEPVQDQWTESAKWTLSLTFDWASPEERESWFESAAGKTTNQAARDFYEREAKKTKLQRVLSSGGEDAKSLAEQRLIAGVANHYQGNANIYGAMLTGEFRQTYGTNQAAAARRLAELYPTLRDQAPDLAAYTLAGVVIAQVDTNAPVISQFQQMLDQYADHPETVFHPQDFWWTVSSDICEWSFNHGMFGLAAKCLEGKQQATTVVSNLTRGFNKDDKIILAYAYVHLSQWQKALDLFQTFSNEPVQAVSLPPGLNYGVVLTANEAAFCREKLGLPAITDPLRIHMGKPLLNLGMPSVFTADQDGLWIGIAGQLKRLDFDLHTNYVAQLPMNPSMPITAICTESSNVWIGTAGAGLIQVNRATGNWKQYTVDDGLMMNSMSCLYVAGDTLWIGYGYMRDSRDGGGVGRMDLAAKKFQSFTLSFSHGTLTHRVLGGNAVIEDFSEPTRRTVVTLAAEPGTDVWFSNGAFDLRHYQVNSNTWDGIPQTFAVSSLAIGAGRLFATRSWFVPFGADKTGPIGVSVLNLKDQQWEDFPKVPGLPSGSATTVTADGSTFWVGGTGYIAQLDPVSHKVLHYAYVRTGAVDHIQVGGNYLWAQFDWHLYRTPLGSLR